MNFKAKIVNGVPVFKGIPEVKANGDVVVHLPTLTMVTKFMEENAEKIKSERIKFKQEVKNGKRNIQQIQGELDERSS